MSTISLFNESETALTNKSIEEGLGGNICRCTGYSKIVDAIYSFTENTDFITTINSEFKNEN